MLLEYAVLSQDNHLFSPAEVLVIVVWFWQPGSFDSNDSHNNKKTKKKGDSVYAA